MVKQWDQLGHGEDIVECPTGDYVLYADYQSLQAALREALEDWEGWMPTKRSSSTLAEKGRARIVALRAQFLDDQPTKEPS